MWICVAASPATSSISLPSASEPRYFFLVRHGIYLSTSTRDEGLIELGRQQAYAAAETIDFLARSFDRSSRLLFTDLIHSGYKRAYQTGFITGRRLEEIQRLDRSLNGIYKRLKCWGEIHSIEQFRQHWQQIQRLYFSPSPPHHSSAKHYVIFSHGNLVSSIISFLTSNASWDRCQFHNIAPHCSVSVLSYTSGDLLPRIVCTPFQISHRSLPMTINNVNPRKIRLEEFLTNGIVNEENWKRILGTIIPERVVGSYTDQISLVSKFLPGNVDEAQQILLIFKEYHSRLMTADDKSSLRNHHSDSDSEEEEVEDATDNT